MDGRRTILKASIQTEDSAQLLTIKQKSVCPTSMNDLERLRNEINSLKARRLTLSRGKLSLELTIGEIDQKLDQKNRELFAILSNIRNPEAPQ